MSPSIILTDPELEPDIEKVQLKFSVLKVHAVKMDWFPLQWWRPTRDPESVIVYVTREDWKKYNSPQHQRKISLEDREEKKKTEEKEKKQRERRWPTPKIPLGKNLAAAPKSNGVSSASLQTNSIVAPNNVCFEIIQENIPGQILHIYHLALIYLHNGKTTTRRFEEKFLLHRVKFNGKIWLIIPEPLKGGFAGRTEKNWHKAVVARTAQLKIDWPKDSPFHK